ncbi:MAG: hypothetical protein AAGF26_14230 [Cyanobacteria bacterium P01_G01_bin.49]
MNRLMEAHFQQKQFFKALVEDDGCQEDVLEFMEAYIGTSQMDSYIDRTEQQLDRLMQSAY